ncbi:MAG: HlyC/CorC family transporter [Chloroflexi bacterium]|nr:HlyC/CorC family transporter [Chloroflexota bacterium]
MIWNIIAIIILIALNACFVSVEIAVLTSRKARIDNIADTGNKSALIVKSWLENPATRDRLIAGVQLGVTAVNLALGAVGENTLEALMEPLFQDIQLPQHIRFLLPITASLPLLFSLLIITSVTVVMGEQVPKVATLHQPERFALIAAQPMRLYNSIFKWFINILDWITQKILAMVGLKMIGEHLNIYSVEELKQILDDSEEGGVIKAPQREMLDAIFNLGELLVRQVMIPRTEMVAVEADIPLVEIIKLINESTYTKFPVYDDNLDQILGIVHVKDLLRVLQSGNWKESTARTLVREAIFVPETITVGALLQQFRQYRQHIAIVLDEYGGTAGLVTLEDLLEEIVGEVSDPFDVDSEEIKLLPDGSALIDGMTLIEDVNQQLNLNLSDPNYDTIAGYIMGKLGRIPHLHDVVEADGIRLRVESMDDLRIERILLTRVNESSPSK